METLTNRNKSDYFKKNVTHTIAGEVPNESPDESPDESPEASELLMSIHAKNWLLYCCKKKQATFFFSDFFSRTGQANPENSKARGNSGGNRGDGRIGVFRLSLKQAALFFCVNPDGIYIRENKQTQWFARSAWQSLYFWDERDEKTGRVKRFVRLLMPDVRQTFKLSPPLPLSQTDNREQKDNRENDSNSKINCTITAQPFILDIPVEKNLFEMLTVSSARNPLLKLGEISMDNEIQSTFCWVPVAGLNSAQ